MILATEEREEKNAQRGKERRNQRENDHDPTEKDEGNLHNKGPIRGKNKYAYKQTLKATSKSTAGNGNTKRRETWHRALRNLRNLSKGACPRRSGSDTGITQWLQTPPLRPPRKRAPQRASPRARRSSEARKRRAGDFFRRKKLACFLGGVMRLGRMAARPNAYRAAQEAPGTDNSQRGNIKYKEELQLATINCSGIGITEWETNIKRIGENHIVILALQDTHPNKQTPRYRRTDPFTSVPPTSFQQPCSWGKREGQGKGNVRGDMHYLGA